MDYINVWIHTEESGKIYVNCKLGSAGEWRMKWKLAVSLKMAAFFFYNKYALIFRLLPFFP